MEQQLLPIGGDRLIQLVLAVLMLIGSCGYDNKAAEACRDGEREALLQFKEAVVEDDPGGWLASWNNASADYCCRWRGVRCSSRSAVQQVTGLLLNNCANLDPIDRSVRPVRLYKYALQGSLTPAALTSLALSLPHLSRLDLGCHLFHGLLPPHIANFTSLSYLDLSFQGQPPSSSPLSGPLPATLFSLPSLRLLDLSYNSLVGTLPPSISNATFLSALSLTANNLSGPIPPSFANLSYLSHLDLSFNSAFTRLLSSPSTWSPTFSLHLLDLSWSGFSGPFPSWLSSQSNLSHLSLAGNHFSAAIPSWAWSLASEYLDLSNNDFSSRLGCSSSTFLPSTSLTLLDVAANKLSGTIPCYLSNLSSISRLSLAVNELTGPIHSFFGNLTQLNFLDLSENKFEGTIPSSMEGLHLLKVLDLDSNLLSGGIPPSILQLPALERLDLSFNKLSGNIPSYPSTTTNANLQEMKLSNNKLSGNLPRSLSRLVGLRFLRVNVNNLTGLVPNSLSLLSKLETLDVRDNSLEGPLPFAMRNMKSLVVLSVAENPGMGGSFPACTKHLSQLVVLDLRSTNMEGAIPTWVGRALQHLQILVLSNNHLTSEIPASLGLIMGMKNPGLGESAEVVESHQELIDDLIITFKGQSRNYGTLAIMAVLDLSGNKLEGGIPTKLGQLSGLMSLDLSSNRLEGGIPQSLANLTGLESLDLSDNMLEGGIPVQFTSLSALSYVNLSSNRLSGPIPSGGQWGTFNSSAFANNKGLCIGSTSAVDESPAQLPQCNSSTTGVAPPLSAPSPPASVGAEMAKYVSWNGFAVGYPLGVLLIYLFKYRLYLVVYLQAVKLKLSSKCASLYSDEDDEWYL